MGPAHNAANAAWLAEDLSASGEAQVMDFMAQAGRRGGQVYGEARLQTLGAYLERRGITLRVGDEFVPAGKAGAFSPETGELLLRSNPTQYEVWHELGHYVQYRQLGNLDAYLGLVRPRVPEQFVFDMLENTSRRWGMLTFEEQQHTIWAVQKAGGIR